ncbi:hypothetical protein Taro_051157 [Colocasia esculenta]|uniref:phosphoglycerate mutase (2,3-diphosphoglycerate-independent) n=1 Tax=Colocasia esculenta TaxID=4460 RepID=A0A843XG16_COLES|nr:hypothetical protein [Colocasia esculenta]
MGWLMALGLPFDDDTSCEVGFKYIKECFDQGTLHLIGLLTDGGFHPWLDQLQLFIKGVSENAAKRICVHMLTDIHDLLEDKSIHYVETLENDLSKLREKSVDAQIASVMAAEGGAAPAPHSSSNPPSTDPAWAHGIVVDMTRRKVQCKYCDRVLSGGIFRLKQHLAGIKGEVAPCLRVSAEVRMQFCQYMKEKETSKANTSRRRQQIREDLSAPPRRSVDLPRGRQFFDLDQDEEEQFRRASEASRRSNAEEDYLRRTGHHVGQGSGHRGSGQGSSSAGMSSNIPEVPVDIPRDGDPRVGPIDPFLTRRREKQPSISAAFKNLKICKEKIGRATTDGRRENYDNSSEVLIGAKNVIKRMLDNEDRAIIACKQMHDYRLQLYHFGTSTAQRAAQILSPGELDDVPLLPEFETPPAPKRQKKTVGARGRSTKHGISIADLDTIEEDIDDETPEPSDNNDWDVIKLGWDAHVLGEAPRKFRSALEAIRKRREDVHANDLHFPSFVIVDDNGKPVGPIADGDAVVTFNFHADRKH